MYVTEKGRRWELLHSLWIGWTFTLGFFNWIAFLYIGVRANRRKWLLWGVFYSTPFILAMALPDLNGWPGSLVVVLVLVMGAASIVHAFRIRKDYLRRLATLQSSLSETPEMSEPVQPEQTPENPSPAEGNRQPHKPKESASTSQPTSPQDENNSSRAKQDTERVMDQSKLERLISTSYPFPLAFGFRSLASIVDSRELYGEQLRIAENTLAFLASVSLSILQEYEDGNEAPDLEQFWRSGISPGDWKDIVGRCSKVFATYEESLAQSIRMLNIRSEKKGFGADIAFLIRAKNDYKHDRGPKILEDFKQATEETQERLWRCMQALDFFAEYPIRQVEDFDVSRDGEKFFLKCLRYVGDHPSFQQEELEFHKGVPRGDLLVDLGSQRWMSLYPFINTMNCPHCKVRETYFVDMWDQRRGIAKMKSFERGHTENSSEISEALLSLQERSSA